jgi:hypothetical protein
VRTITRSQPLAATLVVALLGGMLALTLPVAQAHPGDDHPRDEHRSGGLLVRIDAPAGLERELPAIQWDGSAPVDDQTGDLVYAGTGCSPASYLAIADEIQGNIALVDGGASDPLDPCPAATFFQKVQSAQAAGAAGFVQVPAREPTPNATAVTADIPALEVHRSPEALEVLDAVRAGTTVTVTLTDTREPLPAMSDLHCVDGLAGPFECDGIDLLAFVPQEEFNGAGISDLWGWTDPESGDEYVIIGKTNGVAFFRVTDPTAPVYVGELPNPALLHEIWHDIKVYEDHAFIVSESEPHGMTVFDLTRLRGVTDAPEWDADAFYPLTSAAHNVAINEDTGYAYIVGGNAGLVVPDLCLSGLHMVDIRVPTSPTFAGCYAEQGGPGTLARTVGEPATELSPAAYVHDTQCVIYEGPDERYTGRELCFNAAEDKVVIADVSDKLNPITVGVTDYDDIAYAHQGWLTEDQAYLLVNDELDELEHGTNTRTIVLDVTDLENPVVHIEHVHDTRSIDHNNYVKDHLVYQSNYTSGLRVLDVSHLGDPDHPRLEPTAFFDTYPWSGDPTFDGTWSNYPYFDSGTIAVSGIDEGLFLLRLQDDVIDAEPGDDDGDEACSRPGGPGGQANGRLGWCPPPWRS